MKMQKSCLYAAILAACIFPQWLHAAMAGTLELRGGKKSALAGIDVNNLAVKVAGDVNSDAYAQILNGIESLAQSDIRMACAGLSLPSPPRHRGQTADKPLLRVNVRIVDLDDNLSVCFVQTCLTRIVCLPEDCSASFKAVVWETPPAVETFHRSAMRTGLEKIVSDQAKSFAHSFIVSNPRLLSDADESRTSRGAVEQSEQAQSAFVASKNSQVFHKPGCPFAQKIASKNLVNYNSRDEAIAAGKRPCKSCNP